MLLMERWDEEEHRHNNHNHNHEDGRSDEDKGWIPRHKDPPTIDPNKIYSVSEASRLYKGRSITVMGVISGIQPMRKMIKGLSRKCINCNTIFERIYDKPAFFESFIP